MEQVSKEQELLTLTTEIVSAFVKHNKIAASDLPGLISSVFRALRTEGEAKEPASPPVPAVPVKKSITPTHLVCLEDGKKLKMLKRHLKIRYNMTPEEYRRRWGLPDDYPMVAPNYAEQRSVLAKQIGLGRKPTVAARSAGESAPAAAKATQPRRAAGRKRAA